MTNNKELVSVKEEKRNWEEVLESQYRDHNLVGQYKHRRECHIENDWLLIYTSE